MSDAYYCEECVMQEKDRDGCPKVINIGGAKTDAFYEVGFRGVFVAWRGVAWRGVVCLVAARVAVLLRERRGEGL